MRVRNAGQRVRLFGSPPIAARQILHERIEHGAAQLSVVAEQVAQSICDDVCLLAG